LAKEVLLGCIGLMHAIRGIPHSYLRYYYATLLIGPRPHLAFALTRTRPIRPS